MNKSREYLGIQFSMPVALSMILLTAVAAVCGCSKPPHVLTPVSGKVTYNGKPLQFGCVKFQPETGQWSRGVIQPDGAFNMVTPGEGDGAAVGMNKVSITCFENQDPAKQKNGKGMGMVLGRSLIPKKYTLHDTSGLTVVVKPGDNDPVIFDLKD